MNECISVIVPVYNVARYVSQCVESILAQDYQNLEVLLINDGSTDGSGAICDFYAEKDSRVHVIHQKNAGAGAAKNTGLRAATGVYLTFVDSDDYLEAGSFSYMVNVLEEYHADIVQCDFQYVFQNGIQKLNNRTGRHSYSGLEYLACYTRDYTCALMTDKLFIRTLFDGIFFEEGNKIDDEYFTYQGVMNARKVITDDRVIYNYRQRKSSVMQAPQAKERIMFDRVDFIEKRRKNVIARYPELKKQFDKNYIACLPYFAENPYCSAECLELIKKKIHAYFQEEDFTIPGPRAWIPLLRVMLSGTNRMMAKKSHATDSNDRKELFD